VSRKAWQLVQAHDRFATSADSCMFGPVAAKNRFVLTQASGLSLITTDYS